LRSIGQVEEITGIPVVALMPSLPWHLARPENYVLGRGRRNSQFNEALRSTWAAVQLARTPTEEPPSSGLVVDGSQRHGRRSISAGKVVLVTSAVPNEGKTAF
jgi:hypothetical protein